VADHFKKIQRERSLPLAEKNHDVLISVIAFNESKKITSVLERLNQVPMSEKVVLNDASTDDTREIAEKMGFQTLTQTQQLGVGAGIRRIVQYAREKQFKILVIMAGNDKDRPHQVERLIHPILNEGYDFIQGSRYLKDGKYSNMPFYRYVATRLVHPFIFYVMTRKRITDTTNGFRAIRLSIFDDPRIDIDQTWLNHYELEPYLLYKLIKLGYKWKEVPVTKIYPPKKLGYTKMKPFSGWWSILRPLLLLGMKIKS